MKSVLIIDDDERLIEPLQQYFKQYELELTGVSNPISGMNMLDKHAYDLLILDVMLPEMDGFEVCKKIRSVSEIPIIMLTARGDVMDRVVGIELGADDYLAKPFEPRELVARVHNLIKRKVIAQPALANDKNCLSFQGIYINLDNEQVHIDGKLATLTYSEHQLLVLLASASNRIFTRDEILNSLKGSDAELFSRAVDIQISRLRQKIKPYDYIKTIRNKGYRFIAEPIVNGEA